jgi:anti-anti-sigma regulatory factor
VASNFQLFSHKNQNSIHLSLYGDFDGDSAHQLVNALKQTCHDAVNVFIDTNDLNRVYSFGINVLEKELRFLFKKPVGLIFIGRNKDNFLN